MIWLITIVTFLSAVIAVMLVYSFILQKEQILAALRKPEQQRMEARIPRRVELELSGPDEPLICETTFTENVSRHGARVVTKRRWRPNDSVLVKLSPEFLPARARITYCQPSKGDEFAMGLQFFFVIYDWIGLPVGGSAFQWVRETADFGTH
jgi:PilZ domain